MSLKQSATAPREHVRPDYGIPRAHTVYEVENMRGVDLVSVAKKVRQLHRTSQLFQFWNAVCQLYERGQINAHELEEIQTVIVSQLTHIDSHAVGLLTVA